MGRKHIGISVRRKNVFAINHQIFLTMQNIFKKNIRTVYADSTFIFMWCMVASS